MHALGSRALGFTQELFEEDTDVPAEAEAMMVRQMAQFPYLVELMQVISHDADSTLGGCDDQFEFEFGLDLILDGLERLRAADCSSRRANSRWSLNLRHTAYGVRLRVRP